MTIELCEVKITPSFTDPWPSMTVEIVLYLSLFLIIYNYFLYPIAIWLIAEMRGQEEPLPGLPDDKLPSVSIIVAAYNEEKVMRRKVENSLQLNYPAELMQVIVVSDGSDDETHAIVESFDDPRVLAMHEPERRGKSAAINRAAAQATGDIVVLSDANNDYGDDAIRELVKHFSADSTGAVSGAKCIYGSEGRESATGDGLFWKYETIIKKAQTKLGSITAADGEMIAIRRELLRPIDPRNINDDAAITLDVIKQGYRVLYEGGAISMEEASINLIDDFYVKVRMTAGGYQTLANEFRMFFPPRSWFAVTFISHKILRWLVPIFLILILLSNLFLLDQPFYQVFLALQVLFYLFAFIGWRMRKSESVPTVFYVPMYFCFMNLALFFGLRSYITRTQGVNWRKAAR